MEILQFQRILLLILCFITTGHVCNGVESPASEKQALLDFKVALDLNSSYRLFSWNGTNCCVWDGIQCDHTKGVVISVDLFYFGLLNMNGHSIWPSLTKLKSLEVLNLRYNNFNGVLPASLGNNLYGEIPEEISRLVGLVFLNLSRNHISGRITQSISKLQQLLSLDLSSNDLSGSIPPVMSEMTFLQTLDLSNNHLLGRIPDGNQMMTFNKSSFSGNPGLCGKPINVSCGSEDDSRNRRQIDNGRITKEEEADEEKGWYMMSIGAGFFVGVVGPFLLFSVKRSWGGLYFAVVDLIVFKLSCGKCKAAGRKRSR